MNLLLINPWITDFAAYDFWDKPLGLLYVASFMEKRGHSIRLIDCMDRFQDSRDYDIGGLSGAYNTGKFHREIIDKPACFAHVPRNFNRYGIPVGLFRTLVQEGPRPDAVMVTGIMTYWYPGAFLAIGLVKELYPDVPVFLGGIYATLCTDHAREHSGADHVLPASSPETIISAVENETGLHGSGAIPDERFGTWPEPHWSSYSTLPHAVVMSSRGCPMNCTVCASRQLFDGFERRSPADTVASIRGLAERGAEDVAFADDALLIDTANFALPMFKTLADLGAPLRLHTPNGLHVREITSELARLMKRAGLVTVRLSLETASDERARDFSGKVNREEFRKASAALFEAGFSKKDVGAYIMAGLPGQSRKELADTIAFVHGCGVQVKPALFSPVPGTVEYKKAVQSGLIERDADPLLHNNTLRTVDWWGNDHSYKEFRRSLTLQNMTITENDIIPSKGVPL